MEKTKSKDYILGYSDEVVWKLNQRTLEREGAFVLPHLKKGMQVLDLGCGPGSITMGIAQHITSGMVMGIDYEESQVHLGKHLAQKRNLKNVDFVHGDIHHLPFEDDTFDLVFGHAVFLSVKDPEAVFREIYRVCKKGGKVALREGLIMGDHCSFFPINDKIKDLSQLVREIIIQSGSNPDIGLRYKELSLGAGFQNSKLTLSSEVYDQAEDLEMLRYWYQSLFRGKIGALALEHQFLTKKELKQLSFNTNLWFQDPAAFSYVTWIQCIAERLS